jgi:hypothetical protein
MDRNEFRMGNFCPCMVQGDVSSSGNRMFIKAQQRAYFFFLQNDLYRTDTSHN